MSHLKFFLLPGLVEHVRVVVAERLRRWTRNPLGFPRAGSNPADYEQMTSILAFNRNVFGLFGDKQVRTHYTLKLPTGEERPEAR